MMHTPGPWRLEKDGDTINIRQDIDSFTTTTLATVWGLFKHCEMYEANAHLIAAAPEMLEALTLAKIMIESHAKHLRNGSGYQKICAAIKKARGEE